MNNLIELLKTQDNKYLCLENNKIYTNPRTICNLLGDKYSITLLEYCIKWNLVKSEDYIKCKICNRYCDSIGKHLSIKHKEYGGIKQYKKDFGNNIQIISDKYKKYLSNRMKGNNNINHKNNTTLLKRQQSSPFSIEFWKIKYINKNINEIIELHKTFVTSALSKREFDTRLDYYINKGFSFSESIILLKERQTTFSLDKCIKKYGKENGKIRWQERQDKWLNSLLTNGNLVIGYSKISQLLFDEIYKKLPNNNFLYAEKGGELRLKFENSKTYLYDFTDIDNKKIIEFHGDLFHGNPNKYKENDIPHPFRKNITAKQMWEKDEIKKQVAINNGYDILVIWESDYKNKGKENIDKIIQKCIDFIIS